MTRYEPEIESEDIHRLTALLEDLDAAYYGIPLAMHNWANLFRRVRAELIARGLRKPEGGDA